MRIRGGRRERLVIPSPPDVESSNKLQPPLPPMPTINPTSSSQQDALNQDTDPVKNKILPTKSRKYGCKNPSSETSNDTDSSISSSSPQNAVSGKWLEKEKLLPFKKRRSVLELDLKSKEMMNKNSSNATIIRPRRKGTEKIWSDYVMALSCSSSNGDQQEEKATRKTARCNRGNGKGWRCSSPALDGHVFCEHHFILQMDNNLKRKKNRNVT